MDDFNIEDYKIHNLANDYQMTYRDAIDHLERSIEFLEGTHKNHFLLGIARQLLDDAKTHNPDDQADFATVNFIADFGNPEMMDKLAGDDETNNGEEKTEDTCDWVRANSTYSMRDVPESAPSKFRALCEEEIAKFKNVQD